MLRVDSKLLYEKCDSDYRKTKRYVTIINKVVEEQANVVLDFDSPEECNQGYNSIWQHLNRHNMKKYIRIAMRNDNISDVYRLVLSYGKKRKDLLVQSDDAC